MEKIIRTTSDHKDFQRLVKLLDIYLAEMDGKDHAFYAQYNKIDAIKHVVLFYENDNAIGCGAFKEYEDDTVEIKRMYVDPEARGRGIGGKILKELEQWAAELNFGNTILETGKKQKQAIRLYEKSGYNIIPNYGQYANIDNSVCMMKFIKQ